MKRILGILIVMAILFACQEDETGVLNPLPSEDYALYGMLFMPLSSTNLIVKDTDTNLNCAAATELLSDTLGITQDAIDLCAELNQKSYTIDSGELLSGGLTFVSADEFNSSAVTELLEKYGCGSLYRLGKPVIFNSGQNAMFELSQECGPLCGHGAIVVLKKNDYGWAITRYFGTWISK